MCAPVLWAVPRSMGWWVFHGIVGACRVYNTVRSSQRSVLSTTNSRQRTVTGFVRGGDLPVVHGPRRLPVRHNPRRRVPPGPTDFSTHPQSWRIRIYRSSASLDAPRSPKSCSTLGPGATKSTSEATRWQIPLIAQQVNLEQGPLFMSQQPDVAPAICPINMARERSCRRQQRVSKPLDSTWTLTRTLRHSTWPLLTLRFTRSVERATARRHTADPPDPMVQEDKHTKHLRRPRVNTCTGGSILAAERGDTHIYPRHTRSWSRAGRVLCTVTPVTTLTRYIPSPLRKAGPHSLTEAPTSLRVVYRAAPTVAEVARSTVLEVMPPRSQVLF